MMYIDGEQVVSGTKYGGSYSAGDSRIVVGRLFTDRDQDYASVQVDELIYFNASLSSDHVQSIYNAVKSD